MHFEDLNLTSCQDVKEKEKEKEMVAMRRL